MKNAPRHLTFLLLALFTLLSATEAPADLLAAWKKFNGATNAEPALSLTNHPKLAPVQMLWKTNFYKYNDNSWFYIEPWFTNTMDNGTSATNYRTGSNMPVTNFVTFVFAVSNGYKISLTNFVTRMLNDERACKIRMRSSTDNFAWDVITGSTDHVTTQMVTRPYCATTNTFVTYTNVLNLKNVTNSIFTLRMYGTEARSRWAYMYFTNLTTAASDYMFKFEGKMEQLVDVRPSSGPLVGGTIVVATNANVVPLGNGVDITNVTLDGKSALPLLGQGTNWVSFTAPPGDSPGAKDILIYSSSTGITEIAQQYAYNPTGQVVSLSPPSGMTAGGYPVAIVGSNLCDGTDVTNVLFGATPLTPSSQSATQVVVTAPAGSGTVGIRIYSTSYGETYQPSAFTYTSAVAGATINFGAGKLYQTTNTASYMPLGGRINILALTTGTWGSASAIANVFSNLTDSFVPPGATLVSELFSWGSGEAGGSFSFNYSGDFDPGDQLLMVAYPTLTSSSTNPGNGTAGFFFRT